MEAVQKRLIDYFKKQNYIFYTSIAILLITLIIFLILKNHYLDLIYKYQLEAFESSETWFKRQVNNNLDYLFMKETIEDNVAGALDTLVNAPKKPLKEHLKEFLIFLINQLTLFFNWFGLAFYNIVLVLQVLAVYIYFIFEAQRDKSTKPTPLARFFLTAGKYIKILLNRLKSLFNIVLKHIKKNKKLIATIILCILFLKGFFFKLAFEIINILMNTNPNDLIIAGAECWMFDCMLWLFIVYLVHVAIKHYVLNTFIICVVLLLIINARAKQNRAKNFKKLVKEFAEVDIHELAR